MSSSQQQSTNSNNNQPPNPYPQIPLNLQFNDYEDDPSLPTSTNTNFPLQSSYVNTGDYYYPTAAQAYINNLYGYPEYFVDGEDDIPSDIEAELNATEEMMRNEQLVDNNEDEVIYSDAVQNAFANYENEYSKCWNQNEPTWNSFPDDEQEEMFEQMRECMLFMSGEYSAANMPEDHSTANGSEENSAVTTIINLPESKLNPDAVEFRPSWPSSSTKKDTDSIDVTSNIPSEVKVQEGEQKNF